MPELVSLVAEMELQEEPEQEGESAEGLGATGDSPRLASPGSPLAAASPLGLDPLQTALQLLHERQFEPADALPERAGSDLGADESPERQPGSETAALGGPPGSSVGRTPWSLHVNRNFSPAGSSADGVSPLSLGGSSIAAPAGTPKGLLSTPPDGPIPFLGRRGGAESVSSFGSTPFSAGPTPAGFAVSAEPSLPGSLDVQIGSTVRRFGPPASLTAARGAAAADGGLSRLRLSEEFGGGMESPAESGTPGADFGSRGVDWAFDGPDSAQGVQPFEMEEQHEGPSERRSPFPEAALLDPALYDSAGNSLEGSGSGSGLPDGPLSPERGLVGSHFEEGLGDGLAEGVPIYEEGSGSDAGLELPGGDADIGSSWAEADSAEGGLVAEGVKAGVLAADDADDLIAAHGLVEGSPVSPVQPSVPEVTKVSHCRQLRHLGFIADSGHYQ